MLGDHGADVGLAEALHHVNLQCIGGTYTYVHIYNTSEINCSEKITKISYLSAILKHNKCGHGAYLVQLQFNI